jgi:hypothetical protein
MDKNADFCMSQFSREDVGFSGSGKSQLELMAVIGFCEDFVFYFGLEAEQRRHDVRAFDVNYKSDLSLHVDIDGTKACMRTLNSKV